MGQHVCEKEEEIKSLKLILVGKETLEDFGLVGHCLHMKEMIKFLYDKEKTAKDDKKYNLTTKIAIVTIAAGSLLSTVNIYLTLYFKK